MAVIPWRFYEDLSSFTREMNQLFDRFFGKEFIEEPWERVSFPVLRVIESEVAILIICEAPGFSPDELEVILNHKLLIIKGKQRETGEAHREPLSFTRTIFIREKFLSDKVEATFKDGTLLISLPKATPASPSIKIEIK